MLRSDCARNRACGAWSFSLALGLPARAVGRAAHGAGASARFARGAADRQRKMAGHLSVRGLDGDLWHRVVLYDARLDDAEGVEIHLRAAASTRALDLGALWYRRVHVRDLRVEGARMTLRHLADNRFNLSALAKPEPRPTSAKADARQAGAPDPAAARLEIDHFTVHVDGAYHPPRGHEGNPLAWPHGTFDIEGAARFRGADMHFRVDRLVSDARDPLHAHVEMRGGLKVTPHGTAVGKTEDRLRRRRGHRHQRRRRAGAPESDAAPARPLAAPRRGRRAARRICTRTRSFDAPRGSVTVDGTMSRRPGLRWSARVVGAGLDPAADWGAGADAARPHRLRARRRGARKQGDVTLARLDGDGGGVHLSGRGAERLRRTWQRAGAGVDRPRWPASATSACASAASTSSTAAYRSSPRSAATRRGRASRRAYAPTSCGCGTATSGPRRASSKRAARSGPAWRCTSRSTAATSRSPASASPNDRSHSRCACRRRRSRSTARRAVSSSTAAPCSATVRAAACTRAPRSRSTAPRSC